MHVQGFNRQFEVTDTTLTASLADIGDAIVADQFQFGTLTFEVVNNHASIAFTDFALLVKVTPASSWRTYLSGSGWDASDYTAINTLAGNTGATIIGLVLGTVSEVKFQASGNGGSVTVRGWLTT